MHFRRFLPRIKLSDGNLGGQEERSEDIGGV